MQLRCCPPEMLPPVQCCLHLRLSRYQLLQPVPAACQSCCLAVPVLLTGSGFGPAPASALACMVDANISNNSTTPQGKLRACLVPTIVLGPCILREVLSRQKALFILEACNLTQP